MAAGEPIGLPWAVSIGFVRLMTHPSVLVRPMRPAQALAVLSSWMERSHVEIVDPGPRHMEILGRLLEEIGAVGNLATDAHLAALALERQCELHSSDRDFARFSGLRWVNPLS